MKSLKCILAALLWPLMASGAVTWLETQRDFGALDEDMGPVQCSFRFVNTSDEPVSIVAARASCGCTTPQFSRDAIAPGDTATIIATYDPAGRPGRFSKYISVRLSGGEAPQKLFLKGTVVGSAKSVAVRFPAECSDVLKLSKGVVMTGEIFKGQTRTIFLEGYNRSNDSIRPRVTNAPDYFEFVPVPEVVGPGEQMSFITYFHSDKCPLYGLVNDSIAIWPDVSSPEPCIIPTVALVREDFSKLTEKELKKSPQISLPESTVDFGRLGTDTQIRTAVIRNIGKSPLKIRRVYTADRGVSVSVDRKEVKPGKEALVKVTVDPSALPGTLLNARVAIITNDPFESNSSLRVVGELPTQR